MSGTSLDGVDVAFCEFQFSDKWSYTLLHAETISYDKTWIEKLGNCASLNAQQITALDAEYGIYLGRLVKDFSEKYRLKADYVSSHGHTVFHQPSKGYTLQIGSGAHIAAQCKLPVICDFRTLDVALGGQGAPLVPAGDRLLFPEYEYCLNLGGIANISFEENGQRLAYDICACNIVLNHFASKLGFPYDAGGKIASQGTVNESLLERLSALGYYSQPYPKSLGREDIDLAVLPMLDFQYSPQDVLATFTTHIALQIARSLKGKKRLLITGGGAFNKTLVEKIRSSVENEVVLPGNDIINFKEAIIFGFLGVLRKENMVNCLRSVTGASGDNCGGVIYKGDNQS